MKLVFLFMASALALSFSTANATSIRQENGVLLSGTAGKLGWTKKYITLDKEAASAIFESLSKTSKVKEDGEDGLMSYSVKVKAISCRREKTHVVQVRDQDHVTTVCEIEIPYGVISSLHIDENDSNKLYVKTSSPELLSVLAKNSDTKVESADGVKKYSDATGAVSCEERSYGIICYLTESLK